MVQVAQRRVIRCGIRVHDRAANLADEVAELVAVLPVAALDVLDDMQVAQAGRIIGVVERGRHGVDAQLRDGIVAHFLWEIIEHLGHNYTGAVVFQMHAHLVNRVVIRDTLISVGAVTVGRCALRHDLAHIVVVIGHPGAADLYEVLLVEGDHVEVGSAQHRMRIDVIARSGRGGTDRNLDEVALVCHRVIDRGIGAVCVLGAIRHAIFDFGRHDMLVRILRPALH